MSEGRHPLFARCMARSAAIAERKGAGEIRARLVAGLAGRVVEIGAGSGIQFRHYPAAVSEVIAIEPEPTLRAMAAEAAKAAPVPITVVSGLADRLPLDDGSVDAGVCAGLLCSVDDPGAALGELARVLRPGGELRFYEHVVSPHAGVRALQHALDATVWPRMMGGCRLTRATARAMEEAGFAVRDLRHVRVMISPATPHILGVATAPA